MPDEIDALGIDCERCPDLADDAGEICHVVDAGSMEVAARVGRIPEPVSVAVERSVRIGVEEAALRRQFAEMEVGVGLGPDTV